MWINASTSAHCSGVVGSLARGSNVGGGWGLGAGEGLSAVVEDTGGGGGGGGALCSAGRVIFLQEALFLRCASSRINLFPHLGQGSFLAFPLDLLSRVLWDNSCW